MTYNKIGGGLTAPSEKWRQHNFSQTFLYTQPPFWFYHRMILLPTISVSFQTTFPALYVARAGVKRLCNSTNKSFPSWECITVDLTVGNQVCPTSRSLCYRDLCQLIFELFCSALNEKKNVWDDVAMLMQWCTGLNIFYVVCIYA